MKSTNVHRILIPVDFSPAGECALDHGAYLANAFRADLILLHIYEGTHTYPAGWFNDQNLHPDKALIQAKVTEKLGELSEDITKKYGVYVKNIITTGKPAAKIMETVKEHNIDLIVMGNHGASGFEELFMGSTAAKVVNLSPCPVITIPEGFMLSGIKSIVLPIDETMHSRQKVRTILPLAAKCKSVIHILGLIQSDDKTDVAKFNIKIDSVEEAVKGAGLLSVRKVVKGGNIAMQAMKYADEVSAGLLAIMTDHESEMTGMFMGAFARQIVNHSKVPVLSIKPMTGPYESAA
jgi:nucleotide-binding universal stress UspA family protein